MMVRSLVAMGIVIHITLFSLLASAETSKEGDVKTTQETEPAQTDSMEPKNEKCHKAKERVGQKATVPAYLNLANCYQETEMNAEALDIYDMLFAERERELDKKTKRLILKQMDKINKAVSRFTVKTNLPGATVKVDGVEVAQTPMDRPIVLIPGQHEVTISLDKYDTITHPLDIVAGAETSATFELKESQAELTIVANEDGAEAILDGESIGTLPFDDPVSVPPGPHKLVLKKDGFVDAEESFTLAHGEKRSITLRLDSKDVIPKPETVTHTPTPPPEVSEAAPYTPKYSPLLWVGITGTVVMAVTAGVMGGVATMKSEDYDDKKRELETLQTAEPSTPAQRAKRQELQSDLEDIESSQNAFKGAAIGTAAGAGVFLVLAITGGVMGKKVRAPGQHARVKVIPTGTGVQVRF